MHEQVSFEKTMNGYKFNLNSAEGFTLVGDHRGVSEILLLKGGLINAPLRLPYVDTNRLEIAAILMVRVVRSLKERDSAAPREHRILESDKEMTNSLYRAWTQIHEALIVQMKEAKLAGLRVNEKVLYDLANDMHANQVE